MPAPEPPPRTGPPLLDLHRITVMRDEQTAGIKDMSLRIFPGEHVCILGPNGCGKSTLIQTLTRDLYPVVEEGSWMAILGKDRWDVWELRQTLGIVSPDLLARCSGDVTGRDLVLSGFFSSTRIFERHHVGPDLLARAEATLERVGIRHLADRPLSRMSSGEAKRTLIARALVHGPRTLLFDEPSNALDLGARSFLTSTMRDLARSGVGILLVTHHVSEIIPEIERVVLLRAGTVVGDGPKAEMLTAERLSSLFGVPVRLTAEGGFFHAY
jgi:iron complex transport system ATP-binding protein